MSTSTLLRRSAPRRRPGRLIALSILALLVVAAVVMAATARPRAPKPYLNLGPTPVVLAHQGASGHAPSNTIQAFQLGLEMGADIIETDVHLTKDGVVVVSHDETIDRMSDGTGYIRDMTLEELRKYDYGYDFTPDGGKTFPYRGHGVRIPTLEEVFQKFPGRPVNIELKQVDPEAGAEKVWALIQQYHMEEKVLINSFPAPPTEAFLKVAGDRVAVGMDRQDMYGFAPYYVLHLDRLYHPKRDAFQLPVSQKVGPVEIRFDNERMVNIAHRLGMKIHFWTINDEATMRHLVEIGADGIITDFPDRAVKVLKEMGKR